MAVEGTYEYACMRAELLGLDQPDRETFVEELHNAETQQENEEDIELQQIDDVNLEGDGMKRISGGLDELNSILSITQKKLNRFKTACGSLTNLLKIKVGQGESTESITKNGDGDGDQTSPPLEKESEGGEEELDKETSLTSSSNNKYGGMTERKRDLNKEVNSQVDKLDSLLMNAENAQYSMAHQTKQMRNFLK